MPGIRIQSYMFGAPGAPGDENMTVISEIGTIGNYLTASPVPSVALNSVSDHVLVKVLAVDCTVYIGKFGQGTHLNTFDQLDMSNGDYVPDGGWSIYHLQPGQGLSVMKAA